MIRQEHQDLWEKIAAFEINDQSANWKFSHKLSKDNNWSSQFTGRVIEEYKKFIFLCCVLPGGASPSAIVDEAWHLHLTYTVNYWKEFCEKTLSREIHHHPSKGGYAEKHKHTEWYAKTLEGYRYYFGADPPADIWPPAGGFDTQQKVSRQDEPQRTSFNWQHLLFFLPAIISPLFFGKGHPYRLTGPQFLVFYLLLLSGLAAFLLMRYRSLKRIVQEEFGTAVLKNKNIYQVARFVHGNNRMQQTAIVDLVARGLLFPGNKGSFMTGKLPGTDFKDSNPLLPALARYYKEGDIVTLPVLTSLLDDQSTFDPELQDLFIKAKKTDVVTVVLFAAVILIAFARIIQGFANDKPVNILLVLVFIAFVSSVATVKRMSGREILRRILKTTYAKKEFPAESGITNNITADFALLGIGAITALYGYDYLASSFASHYKENSSSSAGGCGSSCGGGCGSGCGGGGCGGCGGGD